MEAVQADLEALLAKLTADGLVDEQFAQLLQLQDDTNPDFVVDVVALYFEDSAAKIDKIAARLAAQPVDFGDVDQHVHQFKGSSASFGARRIVVLCAEMREACQRCDAPACQALVQQAAVQFQLLKDRLQVFMQLEARRKQLAAGAAGPG